MKINTLPENLVLVSAISKPQRLFEFLPEGIKYEFFEDHYDFVKEDITQIQAKYNTRNIIVTKKDFVKLQKFDMDLYVIDLEVEINTEIVDKVGEYLVDS